MANDKFRKMKLRPKAKPAAAQAWDAPKPDAKRVGKRQGNGRRTQESD